MNLFLASVLSLLWTLHFALPGIVFIFSLAWVIRRNEVRGIKETDKIVSADELASLIFLTFLGTAAAVAIMATLMANLSDLYNYPFASAFGVVAFERFARWLMARIIKSAVTNVADSQ